MPEEFEVKVLSIDLAAIREKLEEIGKLDRQQVTLHDFFFENAFTKANKTDVRLRETETERTLTFKGDYKGELGRQSREEIELPIPSLEFGKSLLRLAGFIEISERIIHKDYYTVGLATVEIIYNPLFPPYLEVEGDPDEVIRVCEQLGIEDSEIMVGGNAYVRPETGLPTSQPDRTA